METKLYQFYDSDGELYGLFLIPDKCDYNEIVKCYNDWYENFQDKDFEDFASSVYGLKDIERVFVEEEIYPSI